jgi:hypothetical protein
MSRSLVDLRPLWIDTNNHPMACFNVFGAEYAIYEVEDNPATYLAVFIDDTAKLNLRILGGKHATIDDAFETIGDDLKRRDII